MRAIRVEQFGGPEVLKLQEVSDPKPRADEVVVRLHAIGVNPVEAYIRTGTYASKPNLPYTPGTDAAGVVLAAGPEVKRFKEGDRVYTAGAKSGTYAEQALCDQATVYRLPEGISFEQGAAIGVPYATAYRAVFIRAGARAAETVLVHGATGGVGTAAVQLARAAGMLVIGTAGSEEGKRLVEKQGAHHALHHAGERFSEELMKLTQGRGVDVIIEMLANKNLATDLGLLARKGRVAVVGNRGTIEINPRDAMSREADIRGVTLMASSPEELRLIHAALGAGLENGTLKPLIGERIPLAEAARAHETIMNPSGAHGKIVLVP